MVATPRCSCRRQHGTAPGPTLHLNNSGQGSLDDSIKVNAGPQLAWLACCEADWAAAILEAWHAAAAAQEASRRELQPEQGGTVCRRRLWQLWLPCKHVESLGFAAIAAAAAAPAAAVCMVHVHDRGGGLRLVWGRLRCQPGRPAEHTCNSIPESCPRLIKDTHTHTSKTTRSAVGCQVPSMAQAPPLPPKPLTAAAAGCWLPAGCPAAASSQTPPAPASPPAPPPQQGPGTAR